MRWTLLILNLLAAVSFVFLSSLAIGAHRTGAFSMYRQLVRNYALVERPTFTDGNPMDVERYIGFIGSDGDYYRVLGYCAAGVCVLNGLLFFSLLPRRQKNTA